MFSKFSYHKLVSNDMLTLLCLAEYKVFVRINTFLKIPENTPVTADH